MANDDINLDIGAELERQFPQTSPALGSTTRARPANGTAVTEQLRVLAQAVQAISREIDLLEKNMAASIGELRRMIGKL